MTSGRKLFSSANNGHGGNREALLAAINEVAGGFKNKQVNDKKQADLLSRSNVNSNMKRDLVSNASKPADLKDFEDQLKAKKQTADQFEHGKTLVHEQQKGRENSIKST